MLAQRCACAKAIAVMLSVVKSTPVVTCDHKHLCTFNGIPMRHVTKQQSHHCGSMASRTVVNLAHLNHSKYAIQGENGPKHCRPKPGSNLDTISSFHCVGTDSTSGCRLHTKETIPAIARNTGLQATGYGQLPTLAPFPHKGIQQVSMQRTIWRKVVCEQQFRAHSLLEFHNAVQHLRMHMHTGR